MSTTRRLPFGRVGGIDYSCTADDLKLGNWPISYYISKHFLSTSGSF